jgi:hypothetical protein
MKEKEEYKDIPITLRKIELISPEKILENIYKDIPELNEEDLLPSPEFIFANEENRLTSPDDLFSKNKQRKKIEKLPNKKK